MPKAVGSRAGVPERQEPYLCVLVEVTETDHPQYGSGWRWCFKVVEDGRWKGQFIYRGTSDRPTQGNSCGLFMGMLAGEEKLAEGAERDTDDFRGRAYRVHVEATPGGTSTRVASFSPAPATPELQEAPF